MAEKTISISQLKKREEEGSEFEFEPEVTEIERFGELIDAMNQMVANESERVRADIARNQTNLEVLATLQSIIRKQASGPSPAAVDLTPIRDMIDELRAERMARDQASYEFAISRDGRGFAQKITASPIKPQTH